MRGKTLTSALLLILTSCSFYPTAHHQFIDSMNALANNTATLEQLGNKGYTGHAPASKQYFKYKETGVENTTIYHYAKPNLWNKFCYYHFIVNNNTNMVIDWGFDYYIAKADPKKRCGSSG